MKTSDFAKHALGMGVALLITIILAAGFATATRTSPMPSFADKDAQVNAPADGIVVTATRLGTHPNRLAKAGGGVSCQTVAC